MHHDFAKIGILAILSRGLSLSFYCIIRYVAFVIAHYEENRLCYAILTRHRIIYYYSQLS